ncbi:hypothetical protein PR202_gb11985 [Eleusine coracana subsp. coracana]|uniref:Protein kinase domain-containing protein n=1 Tax=Eleusine coracana subsp. coracana TaxID=191504 RepID=A0AAV5ELL2_ELECO|nr:hypothetical protein PR202_gb11985 [Eleusine coracana subsp. coracana]
MIKYHLPGEQLNMLISITSDDDLRNMIEECIMLGQNKERLTMYLFSDDDEEHRAHFVAAKASNAEKEAKFIALINGLTSPSKPLREQSLGSTPTNDLVQVTFPSHSINAEPPKTSSGQPEKTLPAPTFPTRMARKEYKAHNNEGNYLVTSEFMVNGSLKKVLLRRDKYLDWRKRVMLAMDAAIGMEYLHSKDIVHFDLKCDNLLVNVKDPSRPICKMKQATLVSGGMRGTLPWMAPELLTMSGTKVSEKIDVYSFGIVMWEILTGEDPYDGMHYGGVIGGILSNTLRPPVPGSCNPEWRRLMEQCWSTDPERRPSFTEVASRLRAIEAS